MRLTKVEGVGLASWEGDVTRNEGAVGVGRHVLRERGGGQHPVRRGRGRARKEFETEIRPSEGW